MPSRSFKTFVEQKFGKFPQFLIYAILEWVMIILLFIDGFLSFISNEFAKFFELRIPCLLCTRIDHILVHRNSNFYYNDSICEVHKKDISSLAYCHIHKKLSDIRNMCERCLLSFATEKDSDVDRYKSIVGILNKDIDCFVGDERAYIKLGKKDDAVQVEKNSDSAGCSCCGDPLKPRRPSKLNRSSSMNNSNVPFPSPRAPSVSWRNEESRNLELPHIRYTELKFFSDTESELPEEEDASHGDNRRKEDIRAATMPLLPDSDDIHEDALKTPTFSRGNRFFGIPLTDSAQASPRYRPGRKPSLDILEPIDAHTLSEADSDSILHRLKRQVRLDRKSLIALYMELDEERSASAVAANNAMAMITRLQADKAAVQMEALQYQRMMEEQAEYDQEALQVLKDLVMKREEEIKVLESEIELYRERYGSIKKIGSEVCEVDAEEDYQELKSQSLSSFDEKSDSCSRTEEDQSGVNEHSFERSGELRGENNDESFLDFENERAYLLSLLTDLERKIKLPSEEGPNSSGSNTVNHEEQKRWNDDKQTLAGEVSLIRERLRAIEAESGFLKHAAMTLQKGGEGTKLLTEIAQHLGKLRQSMKMLPESTDP